LGGSVTEIVFALGAGDKVVGVDSSSVYPEEATQLPQVGYQRQLAAEGVLALNPTLILATTEAGPPEAIVQLKDSGVTVLILPAEESVEGAKAKIRGLAQALSLADKGEALIQKMEAELAEAERLQAQVNSKPKVIFIYARGPGAVNVAGVETAADAMIRLAGGVNAVQDYEGYKPLTAEAAVAATPDVLLLLSRGLESLGGQEALLKQPGLAQTPAGQNGRVIAMDDLSYERVRNQVFSEKPGF
jgi:iron complex transport system substrate-binding protein